MRLNRQVLSTSVKINDRSIELLQNCNSNDPALKYGPVSDFLHQIGPCFRRYILHFYSFPHSTVSRKFLLAATSVVGLVAAPALAQTDNDSGANPAANANVIVVTGTAYQNQAEIEARRRSNAIVDTISSDEIGTLPDVTIADSLRRIPGVTTIFNDDIGQFASIRGVNPDLIPIKLNDLSIATIGNSGGGTRKVNLQVFQSEAVRQLQVYKTVSPDQDAGALGGLINIAPVSAFDPNRKTFFANAGLSYSTYFVVPDDNSEGDSKDSPIGKLASILWSPRFGANKEFGLVVSANYNQRPRTQSNSAITNRLYFNDAGDPTTPESDDWNGFAAPNNFATLNYTNKFRNYGGTARLEYKPNDRLYTNLLGYAYFSDEQETRNRNRVFRLDRIMDQTDTTGSLRVRSADVQWRYNTFERNQLGVQWQTVADIGQRSNLTANIGYSRAEVNAERPLVGFRYDPNKRLSYDLANTNKLFVLDDAQSYIDPSNFTLNDNFRDFRFAIEDIYELRLDYDFNNGVNDRGFGFASGGNYTRLNLMRDNTATYYKTGGVTLNDISFIPDFDLPGYSSPGLWLNQAKFFDEVNPNIPIDVAKSDFDSRINDYDYREDIYAAYANVNFAMEGLRADVGVRLDHADFAATTAQVVDGTLQRNQVNFAGKYTNFLPYFTGVVSLTPSLRIKAAASKTLGRPNPQDLATVEDINIDDLRISRGNPDLDPRRSTNLDLGLEYFFNQGQGLITVSGFYKRIKDDIINVTNIEEIDGNRFRISEPVNGETTKYKGVELNFINNSFGSIYGPLQNLGASANATFLDGKTAFLLDGERRVRNQTLFQPKFTANASIFYAFDGGSELRVAMNHQGRYVEEFAALPWENISNEAFTTFDVVAKWSIMPKWNLRFEGRNVFGANRIRNTGPNLEYLRAELELGSTYYLNLNYKL